MHQSEHSISGLPCLCTQPFLSHYHIHTHLLARTSTNIPPKHPLSRLLLRPTLSFPSSHSQPRACPTLSFPSSHSQPSAWQRSIRALDKADSLAPWGKEALDNTTDTTMKANTKCDGELHRRGSAPATKTQAKQKTLSFEMDMAICQGPTHYACLLSNHSMATLYKQSIKLLIHIYGIPESRLFVLIKIFLLWSEAEWQYAGILLLQYICTESSPTSSFFFFLYRSNSVAKEVSLQVSPFCQDFIPSLSKKFRSLESTRSLTNNTGTSRLIHIEWIFCARGSKALVV